MTQQEAANDRKYKVGKAVLFSNSDASSTLTVDDLVSGKSFTAKDINEMLDPEESIKQAYGNLKAILEAMASFGGEEIFEY